ncbi:MAG: hypothetical protein LBS45_09620 [Synergistaceae bacterium]|nr:hypothetical protein [Synergistaceae bacterium]
MDKKNINAANAAKKIPPDVLKRLTEKILSQAREPFGPASWRKNRSRGRARRRGNRRAGWQSWLSVTATDVTVSSRQAQKRKKTKKKRRPASFWTAFSLKPRIHTEACSFDYPLGKPGLACT